METSELFEAAIEGAVELLAKFVVPLYVEIDKKPALLGSGFFVRSKECTFLVSAAHVLETARAQRVFLYQALNVERALTGKLFLSNFSGDRKDDPIDIGVLRLGPESAPPYPEVNKFSMEASYLRPQQLPRIGRQYACVGFPASRSRINPVSRQLIVEPHVFLGRSVEDDEYKRVGSNASDHIVLHFDPKRSFDLRGARRVFPKPHGISGSPVFALFDDEGSGNERVFPVVGIVTSYSRRHHRLLATDVGRVLRLLEDVT